MLFVYALLLLTFFYIAGLAWLRRGVERAHGHESCAHDFPTTTLIVCARNEENHLTNLLPALAQQNFPRAQLEICLVDDRSSDRTSALLAAFAKAHEHARYFRIADTLPNFAPKKRAIAHAIRQTRGEIIVLTDADGVPGPEWLAEVVRAFEAETAMVCGYSPYHPRVSWWQKILALEYFSLAAVAAGSIGAGRPVTCTGSNLAYRRAAYEAVNGFADIAHWISGDDDLLLHKMFEQRAGKVKFVGHAATHVPVAPPRSWRELQAQRTRYASKGRHYKLNVTSALVAVYVLNLFLCGGMLAVGLGETKIFLFTALCGVVKAGFEFFYLKKAAAWFGEQSLLRYFPLAALMHPFYIVYFSTRAQFAGFSWRGEKFAARATRNDKA